MPSNTTHNLFARQVLGQANLDNKVNNDIYYVFSQSFDNLFFVNIFSPRKKDKSYCQLGHYAHHNNTQRYLINLIELIKKKKLENDQDVLAYLYGSITHYVLDSTFHPFVYYKAGKLNKKEKDSYKYRGIHHLMENQLDCYFYNLNHQKYNSYRHYKINYPKTKFNANLTDLINENFHQVFNRNDVAKNYLKGIKTARFVYHYGVLDRFGIKKVLYSFIDLFRPAPCIPMKYVSSYTNKIDPRFLNLDHKIWYHPVTKESYTYSVNDLYDLALNNCLNIIRHVNSVLNKTEEITTLLKVLPNVSYLTGLTLDKEYEIKYFEY